MFRRIKNKKEAIIKLFKFLLLIFICVAISCQQLSTEAEPTAELPVMLNLHPAIENGFDVTQVIVTITRDQFVSSLNLTIEDTLAYGTFYDLEPGIYDIYVEVYEEDLLIATGTGTGEVIAGETTTVEIELVFVPLTGNLQIIVNWGGFLIPLPHRILFIGNSITYYNGGVDLHTMNLANSIDSTLAVTCESITGGGFTLEQHYNLPATLQLITEGDYDIVIL
ncbi:MAG: hypothetical protein H8E11_05685 [Candidatus Cloacimonetes bacterium]|nr:hypothetical protein [Candidatus Cloacimonadota bacterium]